MIKKNFRIMAGGYKMVTFHTIEGALEDLKRGKIILVTDDENRENEGDFICAAQFATTENINFMATHGKGLICMPMSEEYVEKLKLPQMVEIIQIITKQHLLYRSIILQQRQEFQQ